MARGTLLQLSLSLTLPKITGTEEEACYRTIRNVIGESIREEREDNDRKQRRSKPKLVRSHNERERSPRGKKDRLFPPFPVILLLDSWRKQKKGEGTVMVGGRMGGGKTNGWEISMISVG